MSETAKGKNSLTGIAALQTVGTRRHRTTPPPPLHAARQTLVPVLTPASGRPEQGPAPKAAEIAANTVEAAAPTPEASPAAVTSSLAPATISLDRAAEEVLEAVRAAGRFSTPRIDSNRSATIRLAIARLAEQMTPPEIAAELARRAPPTTTTGRKRL